ncbi:hypothetical protein [Actinacidiphila rubida]|uniref:hypothetical protein n=1 Tax=Actinacidiphila rubida TaxID=310780 RepID=UPI0008499EE7|nr:hypothetical protein [Actinacidiphila rubida]
MPARLRLLRGVVIALAAAVAALLLAIGLTASGAWDGIGHRAAPRVTGADGLYFALNDMDAQAANLLLSSGGRGLAPMAPQHTAAQTEYGTARHQVSQDLLTLAAAAQGDARASQTIVGFDDGFARYQELVGRSLENDLHPEEKANALADYRTATDLLRQTLLPAALQLGQANDGAFEDTYRGARSDISAELTALLVLGGLLLAAVLAVQAALVRDFRRLLSPALAAATVCLVAACALGWSVLATQSHDLRVARRDAFDSVVALSQARALSYDANADESRYLLDPQRRGTYEQSFEDISQRLLTLPDAALDTYDGQLSDALSAYRHDHTDLRFTGYFGDEFRNITFPGERAAAESAVDAYARYEADDRTIRALVREGRMQDAAEFCIGWDTDESNHHFGEYDVALKKLIAINDRAYGRAVGSGRGALTGGLVGAGGLLAGAATLTVLGLRPRLAEFA